jgi:hypothetical protein
MFHFGPGSLLHKFSSAGATLSQAAEKTAGKAPGLVILSEAKNLSSIEAKPREILRFAQNDSCLKYFRSFCSRYAIPLGRRITGRLRFSSLISVSSITGAGPEMPPSLRTRQKCSAMKILAIRGMAMQCQM